MTTNGRLPTEIDQHVGARSRVSRTFRFNDQSMSTLLTVADAAELGRLLAAPAAQQ